MQKLHMSHGKHNTESSLYFQEWRLLEPSSFDQRFMLDDFHVFLHLFPGNPWKAMHRLGPKGLLLGAELLWADDAVEAA